MEPCKEHGMFKDGCKYCEAYAVFRGKTEASSVRVDGLVSLPSDLSVEACIEWRKANQSYGNPSTADKIIDFLIVKASTLQTKNILLTSKLKVARGEALSVAEFAKLHAG